MPEAWKKDPRFGNYLRTILAKYGYTMNDCAKILGITATYMSDVIRGNRPPFREPALSNIAKYIGLTPDEIEEMYNLEGLVRDQIPSDVQAIIMADPKWIDLIRNNHDLPKNLEPAKNNGNHLQLF